MEIYIILSKLSIRNLTKLMPGFVPTRCLVILTKHREFVIFHPYHKTSLFCKFEIDDKPIRERTGV